MKNVYITVFGYFVIIQHAAKVSMQWLIRSLKYGWPDLLLGTAIIQLDFHSWRTWAIVIAYFANTIICYSAGYMRGIQEQ